MNNLSWLLFWADVLPSVASWLCIVSFLMFAVSLFLIGIGFGVMADSAKIDKKWGLVDKDDPNSDYAYSYTEKTDTDQMKIGVFVRRIGFVLAPLFFVLWGGSFLVPEKQTFYMIAASESGEKVMQTPEFAKMRAVINNYLDEQLPSKKEDKDDRGGG